MKWVFNNPARVTIEGGGGGGLGQLAALVAVAAAAVAVVLFVIEHLALIAAGLVTAAIVTAVSVRLLHRFTLVQWAPRPYRGTLPAAVTIQAVSAPHRPAIEAAALHIHLHDVSAGEAAAIMRELAAPRSAGGASALLLARDERSLADHAGDQAPLA
jgi:hypothetical protein